MEEERMDTMHGMTKPELRRFLLRFTLAIVVLMALLAWGMIATADAQTTVDLSKAKLAWTWAQGSGGTVTGFKMKCGLMTGSEVIQVGIADPAARSVAVSTVVSTPGTYFCRVHATNGTLESTASNEVNFIAAAAPAAPSQLLIQGQ